MEQRKLASQGLTASAMGLGCMGMSDFYGGATMRSPFFHSSSPGLPRFR